MTMNRYLRPILALSCALSFNASADLIGYWDFESDFTDKSGEGNDGTAFGTTTIDLVTPAAAGNGSMNLLNADDSYLSINDGAGGMKISDLPAFTISMWVNSAVVQDDKRVFSEASSIDNNPLYNIGTGAAGDGTNQVDFYHRYVDGSISNNHGLSVGEPYGDGNWHHIAVVDVAGTVDIYIDGVFDTQFTYDDESLEVDTTTFGGILRATSCCGFSGNMDDIAVWDQELIAADIASLANGSVSPPDLEVAPTDSDMDGMRDSYEQIIIDFDPDDGIRTILDVLPGDDFDTDMASNIDEETNLTDPTNPDSDADGANDGSETNTGTWMSVTDRGTDPLDDDSDNDELLDGVENPDLPYVGAMQPGTDPNILDTDEDSIGDGTEITRGSDPTDPNDPGTLPALSIDFNSTTQDGASQSAGSALPRLQCWSRGGCRLHHPELQRLRHDGFDHTELAGLD